MSDASADKQVSAATSDFPIPIGRQIRSLRKAKDLSTEALAKAVGRSAGYINNVERGRTEITVAGLKRICDVLNVNISWFFQGMDAATPEEAGLVVRKNQRRQLRLGKSRISEELLSPTLDVKSQLILTTFEPGGATGSAPIRTEAEMAGLVLSGTLTLNIDDREFFLEAGDSFLIPQGATHLSANTSTEESVSVWTVTPPVY